MKIIFMGTPEFAVGSLSALIDANYNVAAVVTQPDKPKGRGHKMLPPPVKEYAIKKGILVFQPQTLKGDGFLGVLNSITPDIIVVAAYGKILPEYILNYPKYGCINVHASLLPAYRGAAPIQKAITDGNTKSGITIMQMDSGLDTGDMLLKCEVKIEKEDTASSLHDKLMEKSGSILIKALEGIKNGTIKPEKQDNFKSSYAPMIKKSDALIDWSLEACKINNLIRGMNSWPLAFTYYNGKVMKIAKAMVAEHKTDLTPGTVIGYNKGEGLKVACGGGSVLLVLEVQFEGKRKMDIDQYLLGHIIDINSVLG